MAVLGRMTEPIPSLGSADTVYGTAEFTVRLVKRGLLRFADAQAR
jgi:hypothetical protein